MRLMLETPQVRKAKICLTDYNSRQDIENRMLMADFSPIDIEVLEEILFSSLKISPKKFARDKDISEQKLEPVFQKLAKAGLLSWDGDFYLVDKEKRKYFEFEMQRFDPDFKPDMEFLQGLLKKVPIHLLPNWYSLPRTSSNIFESIVEKHLISPHVFQRYLSELHFQNPIVHAVLESVFAAKDFRVCSSDLIAKYNLSRPAFEEIMLLLEFSFVCCTRYLKEDDHWLEVVTPFHEWHEYLLFIQKTEARVVDAKHVRHTEKPKPADFETQALELYRHPPEIPHVREIEKSVKRVLHGSWVYFDDFFAGLMVPLSEQSVISLKRTGKHWKYNLPVYSVEEKAMVWKVVLELLSQCGMTAVGTAGGKDVFCVTAFGKFFFQE